MFRKKPRIVITPKGNFALYMIDHGYAPKRPGGGYDVSAICNAWEDGKQAFLKAVRSNEELRQLLPQTRSSAGCVVSTDVTDVLRALEEAFGEPFTKCGSEQ